MPEGRPPGLVQTFLPYADFDACARVLDDRRLGKQRVEAYQILLVLAGRTRGWRHHPAVRMWNGYEPALRAYLGACLREWTRRGYANSISIPPRRRFLAPPWLGDERLHASHRANLLRKEPDWYRQYGWREDPAMPYHWPAPKPSLSGTARRLRGSSRTPPRRPCRRAP